MKDKKDLLDFQDDWVKLVDKGFADYNSLTSDERIWYNIQALIGSVCNGGLVSFYYNSYAEYVNETIEDLYRIGFSDIADLLIQVNNFFPNGRPSKDGAERNKMIESWEEGKYDSLLDGLDIIFFKRSDELEEKLVQFIEANVLSK